MFCLPNAFWKSPETGGRACCFQSKLDIPWHEYIYFTEYFVNTGVRLWSWLWSCLSWLVLDEKLVSLLLPFLQWISLCMIVEHQCKIVCLKGIFFPSLILRGWHQNVTFTADTLDSWEKSSAGKYHCSCTENMWHHIIYHLACYL